MVGPRSTPPSGVPSPTAARTLVAPIRLAISYDGGVEAATEHELAWRLVLDAAWESLDALVQRLADAEGRLRLLGAHDFVGRSDRDCETCGKPDRHPLHSAMMVKRGGS